MVLRKSTRVAKVASIAKQYAIPGAIVVALLLGGYKIFQMIFGDDKREDDNDATTIDISPQGNGDELKQKNEKYCYHRSSHFPLQ